MQLNEYQQLALRSAVTQDIETNVSHFGFGLVAEAGEVATIFQKYFRGDSKYCVPGFWDELDTADYACFTPEALDMVEKELGDVLWHLAALADTFGLTLDNVAKTNIKKLEKRQIEGSIKGDGDNR